MPTTTHTHTLSTFKAKSSGSMRNSHYFSSLDNRSQRHQYFREQQQQYDTTTTNYKHRLKKQQPYDSLTPYSVANLPKLHTNSASSSSQSSNDTTTTTTNIRENNYIVNGVPEYYHLNGSRTKQGPKYNHEHYISTNHAKTTTTITTAATTTTTSTVVNIKRNKLQHKHLAQQQQPQPQQ